MTLLHVFKTNLSLFNSSFENILGSDILEMFPDKQRTNFIHLQNIKITQTELFYSAIYILGGIINLIIDTLEIDQSTMWYWNCIALYSFSSGNIVFVNGMLFQNNNARNINNFIFFSFILLKSIC